MNNLEQIKYNLEALKENCHRRTPLQETVYSLVLNLGHIHTVEQWAQVAGYSRSYFCRKMKKIYCEKPSVILQKVKLLKIVLLFSKNPSQKAFIVAQKTGFSNEKAMGQFLARNEGVTIPKIRIIAKDKNSRNLYTEKIKAGTLNIKVISELINGQEPLYKWAQKAE